MVGCQSLNTFFVKDCGPKIGPIFFWVRFQVKSLASEAVEGTSLTFQCIDDVHGSDGLSFGMLGVSDCIPDDIFKEDLQNTSGLFVDEARDALDTTTASQSADGRLSDSLDVITKYLPVTLGASLS